jgi:hypothetical protein
MQKLLFATLVALAPLASAANELNYNYVEGGFLRADVEDFDEGDGFQLGGSIAIGQAGFAFVDYQDVSFDTGGLDVDVQVIYVGGGLHWDVSGSTDVIARAAFVSTEADARFGAARASDDDTGFLIGVAFRGLPMPQFELEGGIDYVDVGDGDGEAALRGDARYFFTPQFSLGAGVTVADEETDIRILARYSF